MKQLIMRAYVGFVVGLVFIASYASAEVKLPGIFGSNMVLQRSDHTAVWGMASPGEAVKLQLAAAEMKSPILQNATADGAGKWQMHLDLREAPDAPVSVTVWGAGESRVVLTNVLIGDVWVCAGQSNMGRLMQLSQDAEQQIANANYPSLRLFIVQRQISLSPAGDIGGKWMVCTPENVKKFSAVGYYFGREIWNCKKIPMGLITPNWGGTPAETWTSVQSLQAGGDRFATILQRRKVGEEKDKRAAVTRPTTQTAFNQRSAGALYNGMIAPMMPLTIKGTLWYQGEDNVARAAQYESLLTTLIGEWRRGFDSGEFPFLIVQLASYGGHPAKSRDERWVQTEPADDTWAELRECQARVARDVPHCGLAIAFDLGEPLDIHPMNKQDVGRRLALVARKIAYGESDLIASGPVYKSADFTNGKAVITFDSVGGGLISKGEKLEGFAICADSDPAGKHIWKWADARIEGNQVIVWRPDVPHPVAVRYAWAGYCPANLYNKEGLPAVPFRTDNFARLTENER